MRVDGKVALITGAANGIQGELMGIGGATAWLFAREGARVVLTDIQEELGQGSASQIRDSRADALFIRLDVTSEEEWIGAINTTVAHFGRLDILVNSAGPRESYCVEDTSEEIWDDILDSHAKGTFLGMKHAIPEMRNAGGGSIVNISSIRGIAGHPTRTSYTAAKGAVRLLSKAAAIQYAGENIRVNSVHPGTVLTPRTRQGMSDPETRSSEISKTPLGRLGTAEEIAYAILYLASDESTYVTGSELVIDGGQLAQ